MRTVAHEGIWRLDIDGLRAIAVLAVIGYHYFPAAVPGGFAGVDVFFVLSGYLITGILVTGLADGRFSVAGFYLRRIRRLFPALAVVLAALLAFGWHWMFEDEYARLGAHAAAGAGFVANLLLWRESGYFDASIESKPLAHLWSLGVEEQFYFLWPLLLWSVWGRRRMGRAIAGLLLLSLAAGVWMLDRDRPTAFYLPLFRFWELMAGGLLAVAGVRTAAAGWLQRRGDALSLAGLALLGASFFLIDSRSAFPGLWALLPVLGTVSLIAAGPQALCNRTILACRPLGGIGLVSFPLYLWHWPLLVAARMLFNAEPQPAGMLVLLALSGGLAFLTYRWVELPIRSSAHLRRDAAALAGVVLVLGLAGAWIARQDGIAGRTSRPVPAAIERPIPRSEFVVDDCRIAGPAARAAVAHCARDMRGPERFALVGDSKAAALFDGLVRTSSPQGRWLYVGGSLDKSNAVPVLSSERPYRSYQAAARVALDTVAGNPHIEVVVLATATRALFRLRREDTIEDLPGSDSYELARDGLQRFVGQLLQAGKRIVLLVDNPTLPDPQRCLAEPRVALPQPMDRWFGTDARSAACQLSLSRHLQLSARYRQLLEEIRRLDPGRVAIFDTLPYLCDAGRDLCGPVAGGRALYGVTDHVSGHAAARIGTGLNAVLLGRGTAARELGAE